jgi:hypothetical protein
MSERIAGTLSLDVDGKKYTVGDGSFTVNVSGKKREMIPGTNYYKETLTNTFVKGEVKCDPKLKTKDITEVTNATVQLSAANGTTYVVSEAAFTGDPEIDVSEGKVPVEFSSGPDNGQEL